MGKGKGKARQGKQTASAKQSIKRRQHSQSKRPQVHAPQVKSQKPTQRQPFKVPFTRHDDVLLVGEGDFSFALSLLRNYRPTALVATCYDTEDEVVQKHPKVKQTIEQLVRGSSKPGQSGTESGQLNGTTEDQEEWKGFSPTSSTQFSTSSSDEDGDDDKGDSLCRVLYGIDATKLFTAHRKKLRPLGPFSKIVFNFPHVGGLSTDVNRQVRANQQLLVGFFHAAKPLLASPQYPVKTAQADHDYSATVDEDAGTCTGQILVTIFEGAPYTLWNIRDLARHCGLHVAESFKFPWHAYPGYQHARTIGDITSGKDRAAEGKRKGAWRGEERDARCYVLQSKEDGASRTNGQFSKKRGRLRDNNEDSD